MQIPEHISLTVPIKDSEIQPCDLLTYIQNNYGTYRIIYKDCVYTMDYRTDRANIHLQHTSENEAVVNLITIG